MARKARKYHWKAVILTVIIEAVTVFFRFGMGLESTRDTASTVGRLTFGIRIHHGYVGVVMAAAVLLLMRKESKWRSWLLAIGIALIASDLIHHILVLWPITGSPEFHMVYPE